MPSTFDDIRREALIQRKWKFHPHNPSGYPEGILVTGANSFLGVHTIKALQSAGIGPLHVLLRAGSGKEALAKLQQSNLRWGLGEFKQENTFIHLGDLSRNEMGLTSAGFQHLSKATGTVIHLAMTPLYHLPYDHFKRMWVPELERMIAFCGNPRFPKRLHYPSSVHANFFRNADDFKALNSNAWQSGYAGFKWVAGKALENAFRQHLRGCVYDIPLVLGIEKSGICPLHYTLWMILDIFLKTGHFFPFSFRVLPVDTLATIIVYNIRQERDGRGDAMIRPFLEEPLTDALFSRTVAGILGLQQSDLETVRGMFQNKLHFDFLVPENFYELMEKVNRLEAVFPAGYPMKNLPALPMVFMSNLNQVLTKKTDELILK